MEQKLKYLVPVAVVGGIGIAYSILSKRNVTIEQVSDRLTYVLEGWSLKLPVQPSLALYVNGVLMWTDWLPSYSKVGILNPTTWFYSIPTDDPRYLLSRLIKPGDEVQMVLFERNEMVKPPFSEPPPPEKDLGTFYIWSNKINWSESRTGTRGTQPTTVTTVTIPQIGATPEQTYIITN